MKEENKKFLWFMITKWKAYCQFGLNLIFIALTGAMLHEHGSYISPTTMYTLVGFAVFITIVDIRQTYKIELK